MRTYNNLNPEKALIWRIVHRDNLPWIFENGLHAGNSEIQSKHWVHIGNQELITKRSKHIVPKGKGGVLNDYVPFYFTPFSPMFLNLISGYGGLTKFANEEIVILVSSLHQIHDLGLDYVFTDAHAYFNCSNFYVNLENLDKIDWDILKNRDFKRDSDDPRKIERYQAEALIYQTCPLEALKGIICFNQSVKLQVEQWLKQHNKVLSVVVRQEWYFK